MNATNKNNYQRSLYAWRKENGICVRCGKTRAVEGGTKCHGCLDADRARKRAAYAVNPKRAVVANIKLSEKRKAAGLCPKCGKHKPQKGRTCCAVCLAKRRAVYQAERGRKDGH